MWDTSDVAVSELGKAGPVCLLIIPVRAFIGTPNRYNYSTFDKDQTMLTVWKVFQYTAYSLK